MSQRQEVYYWKDKRRWYKFIRDVLQFLYEKGYK